MIASSSKAGLIAKKGLFQVAVMCRSVRPGAAYKLVDDMRRHSPKTKLVALLGAMHSSGYPWLFDECLEPLCGPDEFINSMKRCM